MLHEILTEKKESALEKAVRAMEECYFAMNDLAVETRVSFHFASTDLLTAWRFCKCWLDKINEEKESK